MNRKTLRVSAAFLTLFSALSPSVFADTASTTLGIDNVEPSFTAGPSDNGSDGTTPTNAGSNVTFTATANDTNGDQWYFAVCKEDAITPGNNAAPTCGGAGEWAISSNLASDAPASITYTTSAGNAESNDWYAFACDKVVGGGLCSAMDNTESPFNVNHRPVIGTVTAGASYGSNASVDPGSGGSLLQITTDFGSSSDQARSVAIQADGKIIAVGGSNTGAGDFELARYNTDFTLDSSFGTGGKMTTDFTSGSNDSAHSVAIQSDGKIVVAGNVESDFAVARYNADGSLDTDFSADGKVVTDIGFGDDIQSAVAIQADGKILVAGSSHGFALVRYDTDGSLDTSFGTSGIVHTEVDGNGSSIAIQGDGKIVMVGYSNGSTHAFALARYNADGSLDTGFDTDGLVTTSVGGWDEAHSVALQSDGKIVVVGGYYSGGWKLALARYNADGSLDTGFDTDGLVTTTIDDLANSVIIQGDGKIVAVGALSLVRYNTDGTPDTSFGTDGVVTTPFSMYSVAIQANGKLVVSGYNFNGTDDDFALVRYTTSGAVDSNAGNGSVLIRVGVTDTDTDTVADTVDLHVCSTDSFTGTVCAAATLCTSPGVASGANADCTYPNGAPIPTAHGSYPFYVFLVDSHGFGDAGTSNTQSYSVTDVPPYISDSSAYTVSNITLTAASSTAKSYSVVVKDNNGDNDITGVTGALYDYAALNTSFGTGGKVTTDFASDYDDAQSVALQADGKIVVAGYTWNGTDDDFALARYNTDGSLDTSFSTDGKVTTDFGGSDDDGSSVAIQSDGKIVVAGQSYNGTDWDFSLARYNTDGTLDTAFDTDGKVTTSFPGVDDRLTSFAIQDDGKFVVAGSRGSSFSESDFLLVRYNADGSLDTDFDGDLAMPDYPGNGIVTTNVGGDSDNASSVAIQADGKIVAAGSSWNGIDNDFALVRYNADGSLDTDFDTDGKVTTGIGSSNDVANSVAIQADGKIVAAGEAAMTYTDFGLVRYNADGSLDTDFDTDGIVTTAVGSDTDLARSVVIQADGKIVAAGYVYNGANWDFALTRYNGDGSLDTDFDTDGMVTTAIGSGNDFATSSILQSNGKIVVAGRTDNGSNDDFAVARYNTDGSLSTSGGLEAGTCASDENNCYSGVTCTLSNNTSGTDTDATATCDFTVWFNANYSAGWKLHANPADQTGSVTNQPDSSAIETNAVQAIDVPEAAIAYGTVSLGSTSSGVTIALQNKGNQILDVLIQGTDMTRSGGGATISLTQQRWQNFDPDFTYSGANTLVSSAGGATNKAEGCADRDIAVRATHGSGTGSDENLYWKLQMPSAQTAGTYAGTNTLAAASGTQCSDCEIPN